MGVRFGVIAESEQECAAGLAMLAALRALGFDILVTQQPVQLVGDRWMARATPTAPAEDEGRT
ncbi:hypothetical protein GLX30_30370 [Streptomyces sp. Tu 2975]|uniref:hypothetical protein n=1 Tax=Streptomyces sp. Tu 2975 TaxID=2676871 RepID=UPI00135CC927|nr:hypothetical protein [Streptomyces sp. Tu 2975]QIP87620.1 hypothetical protein GLX30_30370 [Streptomyces sp. Tu 2975]